MGLLDELLGQLAGGGNAPDDPRATRAQSAGGPAMSTVLMALLPVVLGMLRQRGADAPAAGVGRTGGGLGDILGRVLGGAAGGGGLGALLEQMARAGFGDQARSWVSTGQNLPLPSGALDQIFGREGVAEIARRAGLSEADASRGLAQLMPEVVDHLTPSGAVPEGNDLLASVEALTRRLER
jgi:uncharacterized protein YidB (DUF937 family)